MAYVSNAGFFQIVVASVLLLVFIILTIVCVKRRRKNNKDVRVVDIINVRNATDSTCGVDIHSNSW